MTSRVHTGEVAAGHSFGIAGVGSAVSCAQVAQLARWERRCVGKDGTICCKNPVFVSYSRNLDGKGKRGLHHRGDFWRGEVILEQIAQRLCIEHLDVR